MHATSVVWFNYYSFTRRHVLCKKIYTVWGGIPGYTYTHAVRSYKQIYVAYCQLGSFRGHVNMPLELIERLSSGNRTPGSSVLLWPFGYLGRLRLHPPAHIQASFKALGCSYNCMRLTCASFQLTHMPRDDTLFNWSSRGGQNEDKTLLQRSQCYHKGEFWHVSISARQRSLRCGQNLCGPFLRATLPDCALERWRTTGRQKGS